MNTTSKKIVAIILAILVLAIAYYGSYRPLRKAQMFIATLQSLQTTPASSLVDLETRLSIPLNYSAPIGQEELVRNTANSILNFVQQSPNASSTADLISFLMSYYNPILDRGTGMSFGQDLYLVGAINEVAFARTGDPSYLSTAEEYYTEGEDLGPNRPQPLYGLFDVYRAAGDTSDTIAVANKILMNWNDASVQQALAAFLAAQTPTTTKAAAKKK